MLEAVIRVDAPDYMAQAVKECLCMTLEPYGAADAVSVRVVVGGTRRPATFMPTTTQYQQERIPMTGGR